MLSVTRIATRFSLVFAVACATTPHKSASVTPPVASTNSLVVPEAARAPALLSPIERFRIGSPEEIEFLSRELASHGYQPLEGHGVDPTPWGKDGDQPFYHEHLGGMFDDIFLKLGIWSIVEGDSGAPGPSRAETVDFRGNEYYFQEFLRRRKAAHSGANVLELFGSGFFVKDFDSTDSITGVRWEAYTPRPGGAAAAPERPTPPEILGDVFNQKTWASLDASMHTRGIPNFDLVVMRPIGGWQTHTVEGNSFGSAQGYAAVGTNAISVAYVVNQVLNRLSPTGQFFFSLNHMAESYDIATHQLKPLVDQIEAQTPYHLVLVTTRTREWYPDPSQLSLAGAIIPK